MKIITQKCTLIKKCYRAKRSIDAHKNPLKDCDRKCVYDSLQDIKTRLSKICNYKDLSRRYSQKSFELKVKVWINSSLY